MPAVPPFLAFDGVERPAHLRRPHLSGDRAPLDNGWAPARTTCRAPWRVRFPRAAREGTSAGFHRAGVSVAPRPPWQLPPAYFPPSQPLRVCFLLCRKAGACQPFVRCRWRGFMYEISKRARLCPRSPRAKIHKSKKGVSERRVCLRMVELVYRWGFGFPLTGNIGIRTYVKFVSYILQGLQKDIIHPQISNLYD